MNKKDTKRFPLTQSGVKYAILKTFYDDKIVVSFQFRDNMLFHGETFSEITLLNFVAKSYANSCLTLFKKLTEYNPQETNSIKNESISYRYLPAMFTFRHYLELRLKTLYMVLKKQSFNFDHNLSALLGELKESGFNSNVFDEPIKFIENYEKGNDEYFRYLITKNFQCTKKLEIPMFQFDKIKSIIQDIEKVYDEIELTY